MVVVKLRLLANVTFSRIVRKSVSKQFERVAWATAYLENVCFQLRIWPLCLWKKRPERRKHCNKPDPKIFAPPQTPFLGTRDGQNLISWRWSLYLHLQTQFGEDRCTRFRVIVVTEPHTHHKHRPPQTGPITIHCAAMLSAHCNKIAAPL